MKKICCYLIIIFLIISTVSALAIVHIPVESISVDSDSVVVPIGKTITLKAIVEPQNASTKKLEWSSSDETIMTINNGIIKGVACGEAVAIARAMDESGISINVKVSVIQPAKKIIFSEQKYILAPGTHYQVNAVVEPENASNPKLLWSSSNEKIATVDEAGVVTGIKKGNVKINATTTDGSGVKGSISIVVDEFDLVFTSKRPQKVKYKMVGGGNYNIKGSVKNNNVSIPNIDESGWRSGGNSTETVEVTPIRPGTDVITIKGNNKKLKYNVFVADYFNDYEIQYIPVPDTLPDPSNGSFREIIYGTPYSEIKDKLIELYGDNFVKNDYKTSMQIEFRNPGITVAGHEVLSLVLDFCYDEDEFGFINKDEAATSFYEAEYLFFNEQNDSLTEDLYNKLTELYGETHTKFGEKRGPSIFDDPWTSEFDWYNNNVRVDLQNRSSVRLSYEWSPGSSKHSTIMSTYLYLKEVEERKKKEAEQVNYDSSTDGL